MARPSRQGGRVAERQEAPSSAIYFKTTTRQAANITQINIRNSPTIWCSDAMTGSCNALIPASWRVVVRLLYLDGTDGREPRKKRKTQRGRRPQPRGRQKNKRAKKSPFEIAEHNSSPRVSALRPSKAPCFRITSQAEQWGQNDEKCHFDISPHRPAHIVLPILLPCVSALCPVGLAWQLIRGNILLSVPKTN